MCVTVTAVFRERTLSILRHCWESFFFVKELLWLILSRAGPNVFFASSYVLRCYKRMFCFMFDKKYSRKKTVLPSGWPARFLDVECPPAAFFSCCPGIYNQDRMTGGRAWRMKRVRHLCHSLNRWLHKNRGEIWTLFYIRWLVCLGPLSSACAGGARRPGAQREAPCGARPRRV